jgi:hypothetical protein
MDGPDEREYMRAPACGSAAVSWAGGNATGQLRTLSLSGLLLDLAEPLPLDLEIVIELEVAGVPARVRTEGRVAYARGRESGQFPVGIAFRKLDAGAATEIERYVVGMRRRCRELLHHLEDGREPDPAARRRIGEIPGLAEEAGTDPARIREALRRMLAGFRLRGAPWVR